MRGRVILSLCDQTGSWPRYYREAGYDVRLVDLAQGQDVRLLTYPGRAHGILAAPPCTVFANIGARWPRTDDEMREGLSVVDACLRLVAACRPAWWCLENPVGKLRRYLGPPTMTFNPCDFGDPYTKRTCLWGDFVPPVPAGLWTTTRPVEPSEGSKIHRMAGTARSLPPEVRERNRLARSATPLGFSKAFFEANP